MIMDAHKFPFLFNFRFATRLEAARTLVFPDRSLPLARQDLGEGLFRLTVQSPEWETNDSQDELDLPDPEPSTSFRLELDEAAGLVLSAPDGAPLLRSPEGGFFGKCGEASVFRFCHDPAFRYYGAGSKMLGLELTGARTKFWNTDAWADFSPDVVNHGHPDPYYVSIPYLIVHTPHGWVGLLLHNPRTVFLSIAAKAGIEAFATLQAGDHECLLLGAESGQPDLFVFAAHDLASLTRKFQTLVGRTPLPPLWSLGYQQCRWGYESIEQLQKLRAEFERHEIPVDGLWLDIGYMDGYRVFTFDEAKIAHPPAEIAALQDSGHPVVPIIDPGVKWDSGYTVYEDGRTQDIFCKNPEGEQFVGLVWPGLTVFPDFSTAEGCAWWAEQCRRFASENGLTAAWLDMNDPSVGPVNLRDMRFGPDGENDHESFHNQYGRAMARATRTGFEAAHPDERIFLLTRSNATAGARYAAVWTGDNVSNYHYLAQSIPTTLNLALSGIPFNGADVGGFGHDTTPRLLRDWTKAACLFPFFRNHAVQGCAGQEPWAFDAHTLAVCRDHIRLRYRLLPYLYQLFVRQAQAGAAILRPLFHDFESTAAVPLDRVDDAFLVGPEILHAPFVTEFDEVRAVPLPGDRAWFEPATGRWHEGGQILADVPRKDASTPLFLREGAVLPLRRGPLAEARTDLRVIDLLLVARPAVPLEATLRYRADDGHSRAHERGAYSEIAVTAQVRADGSLDVSVDSIHERFGPIELRLLSLGQFPAVRLNGRTVATLPESLEWAGTMLEVHASPVHAV